MQPDIIGTIHKPTGKTLTDSEGFEYPEMSPIEGYHVNFLVEVPDIAEYKCAPQPVTPHRVYAGGVMPVCYVFPSKEVFDTFFPQEEEIV